MAASFFQYSKILSFFIILFMICSNIQKSSCQSNDPQNIQTFYPSTLVLVPPPSPLNNNFPPPTTLQPPSRSRSPSTNAAVGTAIGVTAATTLVISGILFFLLARHSRRKRQAAANGGDHFTRVNRNVKGVIVDENGLDVLYWKKLQERDNNNNNNRSSFKKQYYNNLKDGEEEKRMVSSDQKEAPVVVQQEIPLLRGKSSSSQNPMWGGDKEVSKKEPMKSSGGILSFKQNSSIQLMKMSTPPLPPPPGRPSSVVPKGKVSPPAPPPPPPSLVFGAVAKGKTTAPPLPPPIAPSKYNAPPPTSKRSSSLGDGTSSSSKGNGQVKFKPLHWDKLSPNVEHSMVWDKLDKGSFKFDGDLMEALFGFVATNKKSPQRDGRSTSPRGSDKSQIFILDTRKSQNTAIVLKSIGITLDRIINALVEGRGLNEDTIEKLTKIAPTDEEMSEILAFDGDPTKLADAESFLYHLLKAVPTAFTRFNMMLLRANYASEVSHLKESFKSIESACNELRTRGLFLKLLEAVLKAGNRLNAGTSRGNAQAFDLTALRKLSDVKSSDGKTTLLLFVVQEVIRAEGKRCVLNKNQRLSRTSSRHGSNSTSDNTTISKDDREREYMMLGLPVIGGLSADFMNVKKAAMLDYNLLLKIISDLSEQMVDIRKTLAKCGVDGGFGREMKRFLDAAELEINVVKEDQTRVMALVKKTLDYYQGGTSKDKGENPLQLFVIVRDFLGMVDQACIDIARNVQKRKMPLISTVSGSLSPESPRVFRFPKLPGNFMSETSKSSSSSESDNEQEDVI